MKLIKTKLIPVLSQLEINRFWSKVDVRGDDECWLWLAGKNHYGYGQFHIKRKPYFSHRVAYFIKYGPLTPGFTIDHLCRNRPCTNALHYELVLNEINILRGESNSAQCARKTHCYRGHEFTFENTRINNGSRICRECQLINMRQYRDKLKKTAC